MLTIRYENSFKRDFKRIVKRGYNAALMEEIIQMLADRKPLPPKNRDHQLTGSYSGYRECHIAPDWLLIYRVFENELLLVLTRTGSHSDLFE